MIEINDIKKYKPAGHKIVVRYENPIQSKGGLYIPTTLKDKNQRPGWFATVVSISPGADLKDAGVPDLKPGDVIDTDCIRSACRSFEIGQDVFYLVNDGDITGIVES